VSLWPRKQKNQRVSARKRHQRGKRERERERELGTHGEARLFMRPILVPRRLAIPGLRASGVGCSGSARGRASRGGSSRAGPAATGGIFLGLKDGLAGRTPPSPAHHFHPFAFFRLRARARLARPILLFFFFCFLLILHDVRRGAVLITLRVGGTLLASARQYPTGCRT
jgi:hypothetical protein